MLVDVVDDLNQGQVQLALHLSKVKALHPPAMLLLPPPDHAMAVLMMLIIAFGKTLSSQSKVLLKVTRSNVHLQ